MGLVPTGEGGIAAAATAGGGGGGSKGLVAVGSVATASADAGSGTVAAAWPQTFPGVTLLVLVLLGVGGVAPFADEPFSGAGDALELLTAFAARLDGGGDEDVAAETIDFLVVSARIKCAEPLVAHTFPGGPGITTVLGGAVA